MFEADTSNDKSTSNLYHAEIDQRENHATSQIGTEKELLSSAKTESSSNQSSYNTLESILKDRKENSFSLGQAKLVEQQLIDFLSVRSAKQISDLDSYMKQKSSKGLWESIEQDTKLSDTTKQVAGLFSKGKETREDVRQQIADIAIKESNLALFQSAIRGENTAKLREKYASPEYDSKLKTAFGRTNLLGLNFVLGESKDLQEARSYVKLGHLDSLQMISNHTGWLFNSNNGIDLALRQMSKEERELYVIGKLVRQGEVVRGLSQEKIGESVQYYDKLYKQLEKAAANSAYLGSSKTKLVRWDSLIVAPESSLVTYLRSQHAGYLTNSSYQQVKESFHKLSPDLVNQAKQNPLVRQGVSDMLVALGLNQKEKDSLLHILDQKLLANSPYEEQVAGKESIVNVFAKFKGKEISSKSMAEAMSNMTVADIEKLRSNSTFVKELREKIETLAVDQNAKFVGNYLLDKALSGRYPKQDLALEMFVSDVSDQNKEKFLRILRDDFKTKVWVQRSIKGESEKQEGTNNFVDYRSKLLLKAGEQLFGANEFNAIQKSLKELGTIPLESLFSVAKNNQKVLTKFEDILLSSSKDKEKILAEPNYLKKYAFNYEDIDLAKKIAQNNKFSDADRLSLLLKRAVPEETVAFLTSLNPQRVREIKSEFAKVGKNDVEKDLVKALPETAGIIASKVMRSDLSALENFDQAKKDQVKSRQGLLAYINDRFSYTGMHADDTINRFARSVQSLDEKRSKDNILDYIRARDNFHRSMYIHNVSKEWTGTAIGTSTALLGSFALSGVLTRMALAAANAEKTSVLAASSGKILHGDLTKAGYAAIFGYGGASHIGVEYLASSNDKFELFSAKTAKDFMIGGGIGLSGIFIDRGRQLFLATKSYMQEAGEEVAKQSLYGRMQIFSNALSRIVSADHALLGRGHDGGKIFATRTLDTFKETAAMSDNAMSNSIAHGLAEWFPELAEKMLINMRKTVRLRSDPDGE